MKKIIICITVFCFVSYPCLYGQVIRGEGSTHKFEKLILGGTTLHPSQLSGFAMFGIMKNCLGGYLQVKSNLNFYGYAPYDGGTEGLFKDEVEKGRESVLGGILLQSPAPFIIYCGVGYGSRWVNWETIKGSKYKVKEISHSGAELEGGLIIRIKKLAISGGISTISFDYMELNFGLGIIF